MCAGATGPRDSGSADPGSATASSDSCSPTPAGTTFQELFGVRQGLVARADLATTLADSDGTSVLIDLDGSGGRSPSGGRDVQLGLRPLGSGLAHHEDVCASVSSEVDQPTLQALALASNEACRAIPVCNRIPQRNKRRGNAVEPSRLSGNWPTQHLRHPRCTRATRYRHHSCRHHHRPPQRGSGLLRHFHLLSYQVVAGNLKDSGPAAGQLAQRLDFAVGSPWTLYHQGHRYVPRDRAAESRPRVSRRGAREARTNRKTGPRRWRPPCGGACRSGRRCGAYRGQPPGWLEPLLAREMRRFSRCFGAEESDAEPTARMADRGVLIRLTWFPAVI